MDAMQALTLALGASWASGINLYATVLMLGVLNMFGVVDLPPGLEQVGSFWVVAAAAVLYLVEFVADKIPGVDSLWDVLHTFVRIPAGAMLAAGAVEGVNVGLPEDLQMVAAMVAGGAISAGTHITKASSRAVINTSPEPVTNSVASVTEDAAVFGGLSFALFNPIVFFIGLAIFVLLLIWLLPKVWRGLQRFFGGFKHPVDNARHIREGDLTPLDEPSPPSAA